jgi:fluoride exporter
MEWILIGIGAGLGSVSRYEIGHRLASKRTGSKIAGTFAVNISGAFLLGVMVGLNLHGLWWSLIADGFLGGFTTFSTFMVEGIFLIHGNQKLNALVYIAGTAALGILSFFGGEMITSLI